MTPQELIKKYWNDGTVPIDPIYIASKEKIAVMADPFLQGSGHYDPKGNSNFPLITYNPNENIVRQRFTIAHELGHHFLGHGERDRGNNLQFSLNVNDAKEVEANKFAVELLMPSIYIRTAINISGVKNIVKLSNMFRVSYTAMKYRLKELGYL